MATLVFEHRADGLLANAASIKQRSQDGTYGIRNNATGAATVAASATDITPTSTGVYEVNVSSIVPGNYTAAFEIDESPDPIRWEYITFSVDEATTDFIGTRMMDIESALARRLGPYFRRVVTSGQQNLVLIQAIKSTLLQGEYEDLYLLRRGYLADGSKIVGFDETDRVRIVSEYDNTNGTFTPDQTWTIAPVVNEVVELMALHPDDEIKYAVQEGLRRCYFIDAVTVAFTTSDVEQNVSAVLGWLDDPELIKDVQYTYNNSLQGPIGVGWFKPYRSGNAIYVRMGSNPYPNATRFTIMRPAHTYVNGASSIAGPDDDEDLVAIDRNYAVMAAHVEAWRNFPAKLVPVASTGLAPSLKQVASEFTMESLRRRYKRPEFPQFSVPFGQTTPVLNL